MSLKRKLIWGVIFFVVFVNKAAFGTTLEEAVITALETNPSIGADEADAKASITDIDVARSGYFPSLDIVQSTGGYQSVTIKNKPNGPLTIPFDATVRQWTTNPTVLLSQTVFDGGATIFAVDHARAQAEAACSVLGQTREKTAYDAVSAFANLLAQQRLLKLAFDNIKKHQDILEKVKKRVKGGISTIADVFQVQSRLEDAYVIRDRAEGALEDALATFIAVIGFRPDDLEPPVLPVEPISCGLEPILAQASQNNPGVVVAKNNLKVAEAALDQTLSPFMPTVQAQLVSNAPIYNSNGSTGRQSNFTAQALVNYNLYSGDRDTSKRKAQRERVVGAKKRVDAARRDALKISQSAWGKYLSDLAQIEDSENAIEVNTKLQRAYELQFELVSRPLLDLLDAYVSYYRSQNDHINAQSNKTIDQALMLATMGLLECYFRKIQCTPCLESCPPQDNHAE